MTDKKVLISGINSYLNKEGVSFSFSDDTISRYDDIELLGNILASLSSPIGVDVVSTGNDWWATVSVYLPVYDTEGNVVTRGKTLILNHGFEDTYFESIDELADIIISYEEEADSYQLIKR